MTQLLLNEPANEHIIGLKPTDTLIDFSANDVLVYAIKMDGTVEFGPGMTEDEASRYAAKILAEYAASCFAELRGKAA